MKPHGAIYENEVQKNFLYNGDDSNYDKKKIMVLGINAPALFFGYLYRFGKLS
jgi:hypothetical protein